MRPLIVALLLLVLPASAAAQASDSLLARTNEDGQPAKMPALPKDVTLDLVRSGDSVFHGKGHCFACHGADAEGLPNAGSALTLGLNLIPSEVAAIDSVIVYGIPERITRSAIAMPARGGKSDLSTDECLAAAAYVWVINQVRGEPWPGGHPTHINQVPAAALTGTAADNPPGDDYGTP
ncbi:MAG TPA: c-type cytochrome [Gemmatimonadales bacterium]|nr:c-type cytochrome [Gemmatimonadales bacterium]